MTPGIVTVSGAEDTVDVMRSVTVGNGVVGSGIFGSVINFGRRAEPTVTVVAVRDDVHDNVFSVERTGRERERRDVDDVVTVDDCVIIVDDDVIAFAAAETREVVGMLNVFTEVRTGATNCCVVLLTEVGRTAK